MTADQYLGVSASKVSAQDYLSAPASELSFNLTGPAPALALPTGSALSESLAIPDASPTGAPGLMQGAEGLYDARNIPATPAPAQSTAVARPPLPFVNAELKDRPPTGVLETLHALTGGAVSGALDLRKKDVGSTLGKWATEFEEYPTQTVGEFGGMVVPYMGAAKAVSAASRIPRIASIARKLPALVNTAIRGGATGALAATGRETMRAAAGEEFEPSHVAEEAALFAGADVGIGTVGKLLKPLIKKMMAARKQATKLVPAAERRGTVKLPEGEPMSDLKQPEEVTAKTKDAVLHIIEGEAESNMPLKEFKRRMLAALDKVPLAAPPKGVTKTSEFIDFYKVDKPTAGQFYDRLQRVVSGDKAVTIHVPGDGSFTLKPGANIGELYEKVRKLTKRSIGTRRKPEKGYGPYKAPTLKEGLESGDVTFTPSKVGKLQASRVPQASPRPHHAGIPRRKEPTAALAKKPGKAIGARDVRHHFTKTLGIPLKKKLGPWPRGVAGYYYPHEDIVRLRNYGDMGVISHEVAHHIDFTHSLTKPKNLKVRSAPRKELNALDYDPDKKRAHEGFAEYIRHWLTGSDDPKRIAPEFTKVFDKWLADPVNKRYASSLRDARKIMTKWREQGAVKRVFGQIDMKGSKWGGVPFWERLGRIKRQVQYWHTDAFSVSEYAEKQIRGVKRLDAMKIRPDTSPTQIARSVAKGAQVKARSMVLDGTFDIAGKTTGKSLRDTLEPIARKDLKDWISYAYARRGIDLHKRGIDPGIDLGDAQYVFKKLDKPEWRKVADEVTQFEDRVMRYLVQSGGMSQEAAEAIRVLNSFHIPLKRAISGMEGLRGGGGKRYGDLSSPVKRIRGSGRPIKNPLNSIIENTAEIISIADKVRVGRAWAELHRQHKGAGKWIAKVRRPQWAQRVSLSKVADQLRDMGVDLGETPLNEVLMYYTNAPKFGNKDNIISFWKGGKEVFYEMDKDLYKSLLNIDAINMGWMASIFAVPARGVRLGATGVRAGFAMITNPIHDAWSYALQAEYGTGMPTEILRGLWRKVSPNQKINLLYKRSGAEMSHFIGIDQRSIRRAQAEVLANTKLRKSLNVAAHPIEATKALFSLTESGPRMAEFESAYKKLMKKWGSETAALVGAKNAASEATVDFKRAGRLGEIINQFIPFWNANIQGVSRFVRFAKDHPTKALIKGITYVGIPTLGLWNLNKDKQWYKDMPPWLKYGFWNIEIGNEIVRIPRPFEWSMPFATIPEAVIDGMYRENPGEVLKALKQQGLNMAPDFMPAAVEPLVEVNANYDFFRDRPIVNPYSKKPAEEQYKKWNTWTSRKIGRVVGYSPAKIDQLIGGYSAGLGIDLIKAAEGVYEPRTIKQPAEYPVVGRLFHRKRKPERVTKITQ